MARTLGAKNKEKSLEFYKKKVAELENKVTPEIVKPVVEKVVRKRAPFFIEKPKIITPEKTESKKGVDSDVFICGNPACKKILNSALPQCPYCGCN